MALLNFLKPKNKLEEGGRMAAPVQRDAGEPEKNCPNCHKDIPLSRLWANDLVCSCGYHFRMKARQRIQMITDKDSFHEMFSNVTANNPLNFPGYKEKIETVRVASGEKEAVICGTATINDERCCIFVMEPYFMMGSMGSAVGERITMLFEYATQYRLQMAKISSAIKRHSDSGLLYIAVLTDPTTGGVTASFAMQADIILAEPEATIGFAGARVIEQTTKRSLPDGFQKSEFVLEHGFIDSIVSRSNQKKILTELLKLHKGRIKA